MKATVTVAVVLGGLPMMACAYSPRTEALQRVLASMGDERSVEDLMYLESWEIEPAPGPAAALRVCQLRRANPELAAEIRAELAKRSPLTTDEREALRTRLHNGSRARGNR
jgi:hypothetical protein